MNPCDTTVIAQGTIRHHEAGGEAVLVQRPAGAVLHLRAHWMVSGAPDGRIYLSRDPGGAREAAGAVDLGQATVFSGEASYAVPEGVDLSAVRSAVVSCKVYSVLFGVSILV